MQIIVISCVSDTLSDHQKNPYQYGKDDISGYKPFKSGIGHPAVYKCKYNGKSDKDTPAAKSYYCQNSFYSHND